MDFDHRLENRSFATVRSFVTMDAEGFDVVLVVAKIAFRMSFDGRARLGFSPVRASTELDGGSAKFPHDMAADKPGTDVGLIGTAYPLQSNRAEALREAKAKNRAFAWLQVGSLRKVIQITGPRMFYSQLGTLSTTDPGALGPTPLRYELAYGGRADDATQCEENPVGRGYASDKKALFNKPAPQLEPVYETLGNAEKGSQAHATFGPILEHWFPRTKYQGTRDSEYMRERYPVKPLDFDRRANCWSTPGLYSSEPLQGDEPIEVAGVLPEGVWRFKTPRYPMRFEYTMDGSLFGPPTHLDGLLIDADKRTVELSYRTKIRLPAKWARLSQIRALSTVGLPDEMFVEEDWPNATDTMMERSAATTGTERSDGPRA